MLVSMSQSVRAVALGLVLMHLRQMTAQLLGLVLMHLRQMTAQLLLLLQQQSVAPPLRSLRQLLLHLLLLLLVQLLVQLLVLLAHTPSIQMRGRTARCLLQLLTTTVPRADVLGTIRHRRSRLLHARPKHRSSPKQITAIARMLLICAGCYETRDGAKVLPTNLCAGPSAART
jgi:hypothetical protein